MASVSSLRTARDGDDWRWLPEQFDASILSDEATAPGLPNFTGAFVGVCCQDLAGTRMPADFDYFGSRPTGLFERVPSARATDLAISATGRRR